MVDTLFSFNINQFNRIFPFYLLIDKDGRIASLGRSVTKLYPAIKEGCGLEDVFHLILPPSSGTGFHALKQLTDRVVLLHYKGQEKNILRGQFEYHEDQDQLLFIGVPRFNSMEEVKEEALTLNDFAKHDPLIDQLSTLREEEIAINDIKGLLKNANRKEKNRTNDHLWEFELNGNGDGIWQYDFTNEDGIHFTHDKVKLSNTPKNNHSHMRWLGSIHPEDIDVVNDSFAAYIKGDATEFIVEHRLMDKAGDYKYFITRGIAVEWDAKGKPSLLIGTISNIDQQKQLEFRLKETANRLSFLIKNLESGIVLEGKDQRIIMVNEKFCEFLGIKETPEELIGMHYTIASRQSKELYKNAEQEVLKIYQILEKKQPVINDLVELADGRYFKRDYLPIYLEGKYEGHLWHYVDVTEQTITKTQLEDQKIFYENVLNNIPADIVAFNPQHEYLFINPTAIANTELRKWMIGKRDEDYCLYKNKPLSIAEERRVLFDKVLASKKLNSWEEKQTTPNGTEYHLRNMYPVLNDKKEVTQVIGFGLNITESKKIEEQLKLNDKRYRDLFNYSQAFICTHDLNGKLLTINPAMCELLGYSEKELVGKNLPEFLPKDDVKNFYTEYLENVISIGHAKGVFCVIGKNKKTSFLLYKNFKVEEENSEPYIIGFSQDITDRVQTEKELLATKKVTEDAHKAKEIFLANMSHEIRTPMTGILGIANLLSKTELDEQQKKFAKLISESANNLLTIVNDVLDIEKIAAGKLDLEYIPFKIEDKVFTTLQSFQFKAEDKNINLLLNSSLPDDLVVIGDPYRLSQILNNLLSNALKFTLDGEISINLDQKTDGNITRIEIQVMDTGIGIRPEKLSAIFNPFEQASSDTTRKFGGTGLGLTICRDLVEMQGGHINVVSKVNEGTTFSFYIPYERGDTTMLQDEIKEDLNFQDLESIRILVAEDVELNQFLIKHILASWGCEVTIVHNGKEAVEIVRKQPFDLILMDIQMPEMDGITATKMIRALNLPEKAVIDKSLITKKIRTMNVKDKSSIPIIALTANALKGDGQRYLNIGMNGYISKPYTEEKLFTVINKVIKTNDKLRLKIKPATKIPEEEIILEEIPETLYDMTMINTIGKDDPAFVKKLISIFLDTMPVDLEKLVAAGQAKNTAEIVKVAHKMKSNIDLLGIYSLKYTIRKLEGIASGHDDSDVHIEKVKNTLNEVFSQLHLLEK